MSNGFYRRFIVQYCSPPFHIKIYHFLFCRTDFMQTKLSLMNLKYRNALFYAGICLIGLMEFFHPVFTSGFVRISGDMGDGLLNNYFLEHTWRLISDKD